MHNLLHSQTIQQKVTWETNKSVPQEKNGKCITFLCQGVKYLVYPVNNCLWIWLNINDRVVENLVIWTDSLHYLYSKKSLCLYMISRHRFTRKIGRSNGNSNPFLTQVVVLPMLLLMCHRGMGLPPLQHVLSGYSFTFSSAIVDYINILWLLWYC